MYIPDYQIHNILKEFTRRLKDGGRRPDTGYQMETVIKKVAGTIMNRVVHLGEEEARRKGATSRQSGISSQPKANTRSAGIFHYHIMRGDQRKTRKSLAVENSKALIERFHAIMEDGSDRADTSQRARSCDDA